MRYFDTAKLEISEVVANHTTPKRALYASHGKRAFDILFAICLLPVIIPTLAVIFILAKLEGGSALFTQNRIGRNGRRFGCYKIRTMVVDAERVLAELCASDETIAREWAINQKLENDPRITRIGKFLRATSLDELPQIFNILKGEMSFVGPRPFTEDQESLYRDAGGQAYFNMRPGITGPWQVFGRSNTTFLERIRFDEAYSRGMSFLGDLRLILRTAGVVFKSTGT